MIVFKVFSLYVTWWQYTFCKCLYAAFVSPAILCTKCAVEIKLPCFSFSHLRDRSRRQRRPFRTLWTPTWIFDAWQTWLCPNPGYRHLAGCEELQPWPVKTFWSSRSQVQTPRMLWLFFVFFCSGNVFFSFPPDWKLAAQGRFSPLFNFNTLVWVSDILTPNLHVSSEFFFFFVDVSSPVIISQTRSVWLNCRHFIALDHLAGFFPFSSGSWDDARPYPSAIFSRGRKRTEMGHRC